MVFPCKFLQLTSSVYFFHSLHTQFHVLHERHVSWELWQLGCAVCVCFQRALYCIRLFLAARNRAHKFHHLDLDINVSLMFETSTTGGATSAVLHFIAYVASCSPYLKLDVQHYSFFHPSCEDSLPETKPAHVSFR